MGYLKEQTMLLTQLSHLSSPLHAHPLTVLTSVLCGVKTNSHVRWRTAGGGSTERFSGVIK